MQQRLARDVRHSRNEGLPYANLPEAPARMRTQSQHKAGLGGVAERGGSAVISVRQPVIQRTFLNLSTSYGLV